jgi:uncharacterized protein YdaU (DUF1376 family)
MAKNPIFPLYYNDLLGATKTWTDEEFGAYVRLLIEQWDNGKIPNPYQNSTNELQPDFQRLTRIATSVEKNWRLLSSKFVEIEDGMQNGNLERIRGKRKQHSEKQRDNINKRYKPSTEPLPNSYQISTKNLPLENEYENENKKPLSNKKKECENSGDPVGTMLIPKMLTFFKNNFPKYRINVNADPMFCGDIANHIADDNGWSRESIGNGKMNDVLAFWENAVLFIKNDKWLSTRTLKDLSTENEWKRLIQKLENNGKAHKDRNSKVGSSIEFD